jgi:hypothetical protein
MEAMTLIAAARDATDLAQRAQRQSAPMAGLNDSNHASNERERMHTLRKLRMQKTTVSRPFLDGNARSQSTNF